ncbi:MAG: outer membrane beta-barrel protein, partial [Kiritimatiellae bacterium]|nr:outer membrane beta-barrel protein [Kiritimatiellia bacterium]
VAETKPTYPVRFAVEFRADVTDNRDSVSINKESNVDLYLVPRVDFWLDRERLTLDLLLAPSLRWRSDPSSIQNDFELLTQAKGDLRYHLSELVSLRLLDSFSRTEDPRIEEGAVVRENQTYHVNLVEGGVNVKPNPRSLVDAYGRFYVKRYVEEVVADTSNEDRLDLGGLLRWYLQPTIGCDAIVTFSDYGFDSPGRVERDFSTLFGGVGIEKIFNPNLRGGIKAGVQVVDYKDNTLDNGTAPAGQIYVGGSTVPSMRVNGAVTFGVRNADVYPYASQEYWDVRGGVECDVAAQVMVFASGTYRRSDYDTEVPAAAVQVFRRLGINPGGEETTVVGQIGVGYKLTHESSVRLAYTYEDVDSEVGQNFTKNTGTLALFYQF